MSESDTNVENIFSSIFRQGLWHSKVKSGEGSIPSRNRRYVKILRDFIREKQIRSVVDLGCGDWSFSRQIDWSGIDYLGIDIVPELIDSLNARFRRPGVRFLCDNIVTCPLPRADLAISKDVLQHLPSPLVSQYLERLSYFKYAVLTNDRLKYEPRSWRRSWRLVETPVKPNTDIEPGDWRLLRLNDPPFRLGAEVLADLPYWHTNGIHRKEVLLWTNPELGR
jgi:SAM-dependent methyltransferase